MAGSSYNISIALYDIFGNAVLADGDTAARLVVTPAKMVTCCEIQPDGHYIATVALPASATYSSFDVRVKLQDDAGRGHTDDVIGSPMAVIVTDLQGRFSPKGGEFSVTIVLALGTVLLATAGIVFYRRTRAAKKLVRLRRTGQPPQLTLQKGKRWHLFLSHTWATGVRRRHSNKQPVAASKLILVPCPGCDSKTRFS